MSLIEMIIAIAIFALGIQAFSMLFIKTWRANSFTLEEGQASAQVSRAVEETVKNLRKIQQPDDGAYPIKSGDKFDLKAYIDIDGDSTVEQVHYFLSGQEFKLGVSKPSGNPPVYPASDQQVKTLANFIVNTSSQPVFYYYNKNYPGDAGNNPLTTPVSVGDVRLIKVHLVINIDPIRAPDNINIESLAELRNLNDYIND